MANEYDLPEDLLLAQQQLNRQQKMAEMLMQQNQQPQGQMISGRYVAPSFFQQLAPVASMLTGAYLGKKGDEQAAALAQRIRDLGEKESKDILQTWKGTPARQEELAGPAYKGVAPSIQYEAVPGSADDAMAKALLARTPQGKSLLAPLQKIAMPEPTPEERRYKAAIADGSWKPSMGGFNAFINQMSDKDKAAIAIDKARLNLAQQEFNINNAPFNPAAFGQPTPMPQNAPQGVPQGGSPVIKPTVGLAPNVPGYAQGAVNFPTAQGGQVNPQMPQANAQANPQALPQPPAWVRTQKDYKDWLKSESEPLNEFQGKALLFGSSMKQANNVIDTLSKEGTTTPAVAPSFLSGIAQLAPLGVGDAAVNAIQAAFRNDPTGLVGPDKNQQRLAQAQLGFAIPYLRQTSGASFSANEVAQTIAEFFPLIGESKEVVAQKAASRQRAIEAMKAMSGRGARQIDELGNITPPPTSGWGKAQVVTR